MGHEDCNIEWWTVTEGRKEHEDCNIEWWTVTEGPYGT